MKYLLIILLLFSLSARSQSGITGIVVDELPDTVIAPPTDTIPLPPDTLSCPIMHIRNHTIVSWNFQTAPLPNTSKLQGYVYPNNGGCCSYSHTLSTNFHTACYTTSLRTQLYKTDPQPSGSSRSELWYGSTLETSLIFERWYGFNVLFDSTTMQYDTAPWAFFQLHANDNLSPPIALWVYQGRLRLAIDGLPTSQDWGAVPKSTFTKFVLHVKWDPTGSNGGFIHIWKDGVEMTTGNYALTGKNSPSGVTYGPYPKFGIYYWPWKTGSHYTSIATYAETYVQEFNMANELGSYNDVVPD